MHSNYAIILHYNFFGVFGTPMRICLVASLATSLIASEAAIDGAEDFSRLLLAFPHFKSSSLTPEGTSTTYMSRDCLGALNDTKGVSGAKLLSFSSKL